MVGNALEVREAIDTLSGNGPEDLALLCCELGAELLVFAGQASSHNEATDQLRQLLENGRALASFRQLIQQQGGNPDVIDDRTVLPAAARKVEVRAKQAGTIQDLNALEIGRAANLLGAGRYTKEDSIDPSVGIELNLKVGDHAEENEVLAWLHVNAEDHLDEASKMVDGAYTIDPSGDDHPPVGIIVERISGSPAG
jgi:thymidine phosphorylase